MKCLSTSKFPPAQIGSTVQVQIPDVDRGQGDFRNVLAEVAEVDDKGLYKLGNENGTIADLGTSLRFATKP